MAEEIIPVVDNRIEDLLEEYSPCELDEVVKSVCPFYEPESPKFSSIYLEFHELFKANLLTELQVEFEDLQLVSEKELGSGRVDGSVYEPDIDNGKILLLNGEESLCLANLEVKTGKSVKLLQSVAYAFQDKIPVILVEIPKAEVHLIDYETSVKLLEFAKDQIDNLAKLRELGKRIPDGYRCSSCQNEGCQYWSGKARRKSYSLVEKKASDLLGKNGEIVSEIVGTIEELAEEKGLRTEDGGEVEKVEQ